MDEKITLKESLGNKVGVVINFNQLRDMAKRCADDKLNKVCRIELEKLGVKFVDEG